tara:strand:+ start:205 stop:540 length:336 start_codon:yes stop_codon:yes gene_type:complete
MDSMDYNRDFTKAGADVVTAAGLKVLEKPLQDRATLLVESWLATIVVERIVDRMDLSTFPGPGGVFHVLEPPGFILDEVMSVWVDDRVDQSLELRRVPGATLPCLMFKPYS